MNSEHYLMVIGLSEFRLRLKHILSSMKDRVVTPGDVVSATGLPRYEVLATFHILEALNIVELVNSKGNYRVYRLSELGNKLLDALEREEEALIKVNELISEKVAAEATS
ncbi:MAG: hypothetical protein QW596_00740 [Sulfolobales archaeon]